MGTRKVKKTKSFRQVKFLLSKGTPLKPDQKNKLLDELHRGEIKVVKKKNKK
jgi:hypothetical protein